MTVFIYGFWFGCGFIAAMLLVALIVSLPKWASKAGREEVNAKLFDYWEKSIQVHAAQVAVLGHIRDAMEKKQYDSSNTAMRVAGHGVPSRAGSATNGGET